MNVPIKQSARAVNLFVTKNAVPIFTGLTLVGIAGTVISAVKGTALAVDNIDMATVKKGEELTLTEIVKETWQPMLPTMIWCGLTFGIVITNGRMNWRRQVALSSALSMVDLGFKEYQSKVIEMFGKDKSDKVKEAIVRDRLDADEIGPIIATGRGDYLCKDNQSGQFFYSTQEAVKRAVYNLDYALHDEMFIPVNDLYSDLGIEPTKLGDIMGWNIEDGDIHVRFYTEYSQIHHSPCLVVDYDLSEKISYGR